MKERKMKREVERERKMMMKRKIEDRCCGREMRRRDRSGR